MRISLDTLDPTSALARRINAALARDVAPATAEKVEPKQEVTPREKKPRKNEEEALQMAAFAMLERERRADVFVFHPANGGRRSKAEAGRFKAMGVVAGVPDLILVMGGQFFAIELKSSTGRLSDRQKWIRSHLEYVGAKWALARSVDEVRSIAQGWEMLA